MATCPYCGIKKLFLKIDANGMCNYCRESNLKEIKQLQYKIDDLYTLVNRAMTLEIKTQAAMDGEKVIVQLNEYVKKGYKGPFLFDISIALSKFNGALDYHRRITEGNKYPHEYAYNFTDAQAWVLGQDSAYMSLIPNRYYKNQRSQEEKDIEKHFMYQSALKLVNKDCEDPRANKHYIEICEKDMQFFMDHLNLIKLYTDSFHRILIHYERNGLYNKVLEVCELGIKAGAPYNHNFDYFVNKKKQILNIIKKA